MGDRYVLEAMRTGGFSLGGEQSGHVVLSEHATTGDGVLTALQLMSRMADQRASLAELASVMHRLPQVLINVPGVDKSRADTDPALLAAVAAAEERAGSIGPGPAAALGDRVAGPGDGRGRDATSRPTRSPPGWPTWSSPRSASDRYRPWSSPGSSGQKPAARATAAMMPKMTDTSR